MTIIGLSGGHDANWALVDGGTIIGAYEKERYTRRRHDGGEIVNHALGTLKRVGLQPRDISVVATSEPVHLGLDTGLRRLGGSKYRKVDEWEHQVVELFGRILPAVSVPHHLCHAAYAVYTSPYDECLAVTLDGGGDFYTEQAYTCATISMWKGGRLKFIEAVPNVGFGSLWFTYAKALFGDGNHSGKLMGLAALGDSKLTSAFYDRFTAPISDTFGNVRSIKDCWPDYEDPPFVKFGMTWKDPTAQSVARAIQDITTKCGLDFIAAAQTATGACNVVLSGGVALNGYLTTAVRKSQLFKGVHVPPAVHDGGIALGAALFAHHHVFGHAWNASFEADCAYLGEQYDTPDLTGVPGIRVSTPDVEDAAAECAERIAGGEVVAVYEGRSEHGPRALGNRSLVSSASVDGIRDRINSTIKFRESFRPLAPIVRQSRAAEYFDLSWPSPYMMYIVNCTDLMKKTCAEGCHIDGSARVQTVPDDSGFMSQILAAHERKTGIPVLLNTSFNVGEPIVETPENAISSFEKMPIKTMWMNGSLIEKS